jgi:hypothetical protein
MPPPVPAPIRIERTPPGCVAALYEQRKVHPVGEFAILEDQLCSFIVNYTTDHAVRFDLQGNPVEFFPRAYCPMQVSLTLGSRNPLF